MRYLEVIKLLIISLGIKLISCFRNIPSNDIDSFIRLSALRSYSKLGFFRFFQLFINPISSIRYFEFDFVRRNIPVKRISSILDISSPRGFGIFLSHKYPRLEYHMINPDKSDIEETKILTAAFNSNLKVRNENALNLPYKSRSYDTVISISVIEHIVGKGDTKAIKEMWRVIKPGGRLILTTHIMRKRRIEYRVQDHYNLSVRKKRKYFFQRIYSPESLTERLIKPLGVQPKLIEIIEEKKAGWFDEYIQRWIKLELEETVFDPWFIMTKFKHINNFQEVNNLGVIGLVFEKPCD